MDNIRVIIWKGIQPGFKAQCWTIFEEDDPDGLKPNLGYLHGMFSAEQAKAAAEALGLVVVSVEDE